MTHQNKDAIVAAMLSYRESYGGVIPRFVVDTVRKQWGVAPRTLRHWVAASDAEAARAEQERTERAADAAERRTASPRTRSVFELTEEHLIVARSTLNMKKAHSLLFPDNTKGQDGWVSYPTFARAFKNLPPSIRDGIMDGWDAMAKHQVYLSMAAPHRNHTWHLDHTEADVWVSIPGGSIIRPHVSIVRDNATSMRLAAVAYLGRPNEDSICDLLATAAMSREYATPDGKVTVGGLPVQLILDNGVEHFAEAVTKGAVMLGTVVNPTKAFYKHQNGPAESSFSALNKQLLKGLPGYTKGGNGDDGKPLIAAKYADQVNPDDVMSIESFQLHLDHWLVEQNTTQRMHRLGNQTPLTAWSNDLTEIRDTPVETIRAMMQRSKTGRVVNAEGIRFRGIDYIAPELGYYRERGLQLAIRYLKRETRSIEVYENDTWICKAIDRTLLTEAQRRAILRGRERDLDFLKRVNAEANQDRIHRALTDDAAAYDNDNPSDTDPTAAAAQQALDAAIGNVANITDARAKRSAEDAASGPDDAVPDLSRVDPTTPRRSKRQQAPSRSEHEQKRRDKKKNDASRERINRRPGANFGEDQ